jgi:hypothetical protein
MQLKDHFVQQIQSAKRLPICEDQGHGLHGFTRIKSVKIRVIRGKTDVVLFKFSFPMTIESVPNINHLKLKCS